MTHSAESDAPWEPGRDEACTVTEPHGWHIWDVRGGYSVACRGVIPSGEGNPDA